jgi:hypothetical protein
MRSDAGCCPYRYHVPGRLQVMVNLQLKTEEIKSCNLRP